MGRWQKTFGTSKFGNTKDEFKTVTIIFAFWLEENFAVCLFVKDFAEKPFGNVKSQMAQKYSNGSNIYQIFLMAPIWNGIGFRMPMMHCPTFGSLASLKYLKTCFQISQDIFKISQDIYQMYQDIDEMAQTFIKSGMALISGCPKHCPTFGSLIEHSPHLCCTPTSTSTSTPTSTIPRWTLQRAPFQLPEYQMVRVGGQI